MEREHVVEPESVAFIDAQGGPGAVVGIVGDRSDERQAVGPAAEKDHHEGPVARRDAGNEAEGRHHQYRWKAGDASSSGTESAAAARISRSAAVGRRAST